ncbi:hypothetical protein ACWCWE_37560, partial [Streptomyces sp. NPDC001759]
PLDRANPANPQLTADSHLTARPHEPDAFRTQSTPITAQSFNYAGLTLLAALLLAWGTWITRGKRDYQLTAAATAQPGEAMLSEGI